MRFFFLLLSTLSTLFLVANASNEVCNTGSAFNSVQDHVNGCLTFTVGQGTGCAWMCSYCAANLGTNSYYFTGNPPVCTYQTGISVAEGISVAGGCVGSPVSGQSYTCCATTDRD
jgi:hypothetical protein